MDPELGILSVKQKACTGNGIFHAALWRASPSDDTAELEVWAPVYRWLPAKSKIESHFLMFYARTPKAMQKVDDVRLENGQIIIEDHTAGKELALKFSQPI